MKVITIVFALTLNLNLYHAGVYGAATRTTTDRILSFGYLSETHNLVTPDGYGLTLFRIKNSTRGGKVATTGQDRPVVLLMHGLTSSSDCWVLTGPVDSLAFNLVDSGYDVWLGNGRGNPYSNRHVSMSPKDKQFWRYSWHEIGIIDLPNTMDYILKETGQKSLHYVGHSQGTAIMFVLLSTQPEYNRKLRTAHMLAPIAYMKHARSGLLRDMAPILGTYGPLDSALGDMAFLQQKFLRQILGLERCRNPLADPEFCAYILFTIYGGESGYFNASLLPEFFSTHPASCSTHQAIHLVQLHVSGHFRLYDFGEKGNRQRYNRPTPPDYEVANINPRFPLHFYYSDYDELSSKTDVEHFSKILGNRSINHFIDLPKFAHLDFLSASNVKEVINDGIVGRMKEADLLL